MLKKACFVICILITLFSMFACYSNYLDKKINMLYEEKSEIVDHSAGLPIKDKGNFSYYKTNPKNYLYLMGSSELTSEVPQNPGGYFPNNFYNKQVSLVGHAAVQNLLHAVNLGANSDVFVQNDLAIVESFQWFAGEDLDSSGFMANFSELQFYQFLKNDKISEKNKQYLCERFIEIENGNIVYKDTHRLARLYTSDNFFLKVGYYCMKPYYELRNQYLIFKDKYATYEYLKTIKQDNNGNVKIINWDEEYALAEEQGSAEITNNDFYISDDYYNTYLKDTIKEQKNSASGNVYNQSKEWEDFQFVLDVCTELDMNPYIISMSSNGRYYDYVGLQKEKRDEVYDRIEQISAENKFSALNLKDKEYEPYFYCDSMHLGWKGWLYCDEKIINHFTYNTK